MQQKQTLYNNRELSLLQFNQRVLAQALEPTIPLLERLRYLLICCANLDEFFETRVAGLKERLAMDMQTPGPDGLNTQQVLTAISSKAHALVAQIYQIFNDQLIPELSQQHINFIRPDQRNKKLTQWVKRYFHHDVLPLLSPVALDLAHPFPRLVNKSLNFIFSIEGHDAFGRNSGLAVVHAPRALARVLKVPATYTSTGDSFILLAAIIKTHAQDLFPGMTVTGCYQFRLTRNSALLVAEEEVEDLAHALSHELLSRHYGHAVRLEIAANCPAHLVDFLLKKHDLSKQDLYYCQGPVNLSRYLAVLDLLQRQDLRFPLFNPTYPKHLATNHTIFATLRRHDILLHHPYQSFTPVIEFLRQAALDRNVLAIKQTLYRTRPESTVVRTLIEAAQAGKEVTAIIELRARFDEASNIALANQLQQAGVLVVYGIVGLKTHAKMTLVIRRENGQLCRYAHLSTGNYHESTVRQYTDFGLLTHHLEITDDVQHVFQQLTGMGKAYQLKQLLYAPFSLQQTLLKLIAVETAQAKQGKRAHIMLKANGLTDPVIIQALYTAAQAGVKIDLIIRSICTLKPGIKGISDTISVYSIVGRFLEHSRVFYFYHLGAEKIYCASADLMERNLQNRIEICFPILDKALMKRVKEEGLIQHLKAPTWQLQSDGHYKQLAPKPTSQTLLLQQLS